MLSFKTPKPPVPTVPKVNVIASNGDIPVINKAIISTNVNTMYIPYKIIAVCLTFGTSFPTAGPGLSALIRCIIEPPDNGRTAIINTKTPIPPIQCVNERQNNEQCVKASTLDKILEPVVVKPDIVSKSASSYAGISPVIKNGNAPTKLIIIQLKETAAKPSFE